MQEFITIPTYLIRELPPDKLYALADILSMADENSEVHISVRNLMNRWNWGNTKVVNFIRFLEEQDVFNTQTRQKQDTVLMINTRFLKGTQDRNKTETRRKQDTKKEEDTEIYKRIIEHLNDVCGTNYKHTNKTTKEHIHARLADGFSEEDFYTVIDKKAKEWKNTIRERYLQPQTLFSNKFESYLNQKIVEDKPKNKFNNFSQRKYNEKEMSDLEKRLIGG